MAKSSCAASKLKPRWPATCGTAQTRAAGARQRHAPRQIPGHVEPLHQILQRSDADAAIARDSGDLTCSAAAARVDEQLPRNSFRSRWRRLRRCSRTAPTSVKRDRQRRRRQQTAVQRRASWLQQGLKPASASRARVRQRRHASALGRAGPCRGRCAPGVSSPSTTSQFTQSAPHRVHCGSAGGRPGGRIKAEESVTCVVT